MFSSLVSCSNNNSLYFYETDKISLTIEARPDSSQPVQGNFGLKQRLVLIVPPINSGCEKKTSSKILNIEDQEASGNSVKSNEESLKKPDCNGEALSAIASFRFKKEPGAILDFGPVSIKTAFITGKAAADIKGNAVGAATAIVGSNVNDNVDIDITILNSIIDQINDDINENINNPQAQNLLTQLNTLGKIIVPDKYPITIYKSFSSQGHQKLKEAFKKASPTSVSKDIRGALKYLDQIDNASKLLKLVLKTPANYRLNDKIPNDPITEMGLNSALANTETEKLKVRQELFGNPIYREMITFYTENHI